MSDRGEMWVHGNSVVAQYMGGEGGSLYTPGHRMINAKDPANANQVVPWSDLLGVRSGNGATFRGAYGRTSIPNTNAYHFSIPTPAVIAQRDNPNHLLITVDAISIYYKTPNDQITIQKVLVSDGLNGTRRVNSEGVLLFGDNTVTPIQGKNTWLLQNNSIRLQLNQPHGVLISAEVRFDVEGEITFTAAAIHYSVS